MAANSKKDPSKELRGTQNTGGKDDKPGSSRTLLTEAEKQSNKRASQKKYRDTKKQKMKTTEEEMVIFKETCAYYKGQRDLLDKQFKEDILKLERQFGTLREEVREVGNKVEKVTDGLSKLWDLIETAPCGQLTQEKVIEIASLTQKKEEKEIKIAHLTQELVKVIEDRACERSSQAL